MREKRKNIKHQRDVWHVGKNIKKKLVKSGKKKANADLQPWIKAIINHFWWCCASCEGNVIMLKEKWLSILNHVCNKHKWEDCQLYKKCTHPRLTKKEKRIKKWLVRGSPAYNALEKIVTDKNLIKDLKHLVDFRHTGNLEVYHALYNKYCPKRLHFSYNGMIARSQLAILDHNSGANLLQARTKDGLLRYKQQFSKITVNWVVKKISSKKDRSYVTEIVKEVEFLAESKEQVQLPNTDRIPGNIAPIPKPLKADAIKNMRTRFTV